MKGVVVTLPDESVQTAVEVGRNRDDVYDHAGHESVASDDRADIHVRGAKGEFALARWWSIPPNDDVLDGPDPGYDYRVVAGGVPVTVDVKTAKYFDEPHLKVDPESLGDADIYVLAGCDGVRVRLVGYITAKRIRDEHEPVDDFASPVYRLTPDDVKPLPDEGEVVAQ